MNHFYRIFRNQGSQEIKVNPEDGQILTDLVMEFP